MGVTDELVLDHLRHMRDQLDRLETRIDELARHVTRLEAAAAPIGGPVRSRPDPFAARGGAELDAFEP